MKNQNHLANMLAHLSKRYVSIKYIQQKISMSVPQYMQIYRICELDSLLKLQISRKYCFMIMSSITHPAEIFIMSFVTAQVLCKYIIVSDSSNGNHIIDKTDLK